MFGRKKSKESAKERLKLVLIHDRYGASPNNDMINAMKRDIMKVISQYVDIDEEEFDISVTRERTAVDNVETKLVANIPIRKVKKLGRNG